MIKLDYTIKMTFEDMEEPNEFGNCKYRVEASNGDTKFSKYGMAFKEFILDDSLPYCIVKAAGNAIKDILYTEHGEDGKNIFKDSWSSGMNLDFVNSKDKYIEEDTRMGRA